MSYVTPAGAMLVATRESAPAQSGKTHAHRRRTIFAAASDRREVRVGRSSTASGNDGRPSVEPGASRNREIRRRREEPARPSRRLRGPSLNDPVLDFGVEAFRKLDGKKVSAVVSARGVDPTHVVGERLVEVGIVDEEPADFLGLGRTSYPAVNPHRKPNCARAWRRFCAAPVRRRRKTCSCWACLAPWRRATRCSRKSRAACRGRKTRRVEELEATVDAPGHVDEAIRKAIASINAAIIVAAVAATAVN